MTNISRTVLSEHWGAFPQPVEEASRLLEADFYTFRHSRTGAIYYRTTKVRPCTRRIQLFDLQQPPSNPV